MTGDSKKLEAGKQKNKNEGPELAIQEIHYDKKRGIYVFGPSYRLAELFDDYEVTKMPPGEKIEIPVEEGKIMEKQEIEETIENEEHTIDDDER